MHKNGNGLCTLISCMEMKVLNLNNLKKLLYIYIFCHETMQHLAKLNCHKIKSLILHLHILSEKNKYLTQNDRKFQIQFHTFEFMVWD